MARAAFEKGQRVFVRAVGVWASVELVIPQWVKGVDEPFRIFYDVGLGREFSAHELAAPPARVPRQLHQEAWAVRRIHAPGLRLDRARPADLSMPVVVTEVEDWGGWRVEPVEYDRDPARIEHQAKLIAAAPRLLAAAKALAHYAEAPDDVDAPRHLGEAVAVAQAVLRAIYAAPSDPVEDDDAPAAVA